MAPSTSMRASSIARVDVPQAEGVEPVARIEPEGVASGAADALVAGVEPEDARLIGGDDGARAVEHDDGRARRAEWRAPDRRVGDRGARLPSARIAPEPALSARSRRAPSGRLCHERCVERQRSPGRSSDSTQGPQSNCGTREDAPWRNDVPRTGSFEQRSRWGARSGQRSKTRAARGPRRGEKNHGGDAGATPAAPRWPALTVATCGY